LLLNHISKKARPSGLQPALNCLSFLVISLFGTLELCRFPESDQALNDPEDNEHDPEQRKRPSPVRTGKASPDHPETVTAMPPTIEPAIVGIRWCPCLPVTR